MLNFFGMIALGLACENVAMRKLLHKFVLMYQLLITLVGSGWSTVDRPLAHFLGMMFHDWFMGSSILCDLINLSYLCRWCAIQVACDLAEESS